MTKFKERSTLKQYLPMKPIKRVIKSWVSSDSMTGYRYDMNIYSGKEIEQQEPGEWVVQNLAASINHKNVVLAFEWNPVSRLIDCNEEKKIYSCDE